MSIRVYRYLLTIFIIGILFYGFIRIISFVDYQTLKTVPGEVLECNENFLRQILGEVKVYPVRRMLPRYWEKDSFWEVGGGCGELFFILYRLEDGDELKLCTSYNTLKVVGFKGNFPKNLEGKEKTTSINHFFVLIRPIIQYLGLPDDISNYKIIESNGSWEIKGIYINPFIAPELFFPSYIGFMKEVNEFCKPIIVRCINLKFVKDTEYLEFSTNLDSVIDEMDVNHKLFFNIYLQMQNTNTKE